MKCKQKQPVLYINYGNKIKTRFVFCRPFRLRAIICNRQKHLKKKKNILKIVFKTFDNGLKPC